MQNKYERHLLAFEKELSSGAPTRTVHSDWGKVAEEQRAAKKAREERQLSLGIGRGKKRARPVRPKGEDGPEGGTGGAEPSTADPVSTAASAEMPAMEAQSLELDPLHALSLLAVDSPPSPRNVRQRMAEATPSFAPIATSLSVPAPSVRLPVLGRGDGEARSLTATAAEVEDFTLAGVANLALGDGAPRIQRLPPLPVGLSTAPADPPQPGPGLEAAISTLAVAVVKEEDSPVAADADVGGERQGAAAGPSLTAEDQIERGPGEM